MSGSYSPSLPSPVPATRALAVEYSLSLKDFHALDLFQYDNVQSKALSFRLRFALNLMVYSVVVSTFLGCLVGVLDWIVRVETHRAYDLSSVEAGCWTGAAMLLLCLCGSFPGGYFWRKNRKLNAKLFLANRKLQLRLGLIGIVGRYHAVITPEGLTETITLHEASASVQITKTSISTACWAAVTSIDRTDQHAFFTIAHSTQGLSENGILILPRSAFTRDADFNAFVDTARQHRDAVLKAIVAPQKVLHAPDLRITR